MSLGLMASTEDFPIKIDVCFMRWLSLWVCGWLCSSGVAIRGKVLMSEERKEVKLSNSFFGHKVLIVIQTLDYLYKTHSTTNLWSKCKVCPCTTGKFRAASDNWEDSGGFKFVLGNIEPAEVWQFLMSFRHLFTNRSVILVRCKYFFDKRFSSWSAYDLLCVSFFHGFFLVPFRTRWEKRARVHWLLWKKAELTIHWNRNLQIRVSFSHDRNLRTNKVVCCLVKGPFQ